MLNEKDLAQLEKVGIEAKEIENQLNRFATGFPYLKIEAVATAEKGIKVLSKEDEQKYVDAWKNFKGTIEKFVPASGAASRMFKNLFAFASSGRNTPETDFENQFFAGIMNFAFYPTLNRVCSKLYGEDIHSLMKLDRHVDVVKALLMPEGMNYGALPKALLQFHKIAPMVVHTPLEEHLEEGAQYARDEQGKVNLHFTVSPEHRKEFEKLLKAKLPIMEAVWGVTYNVTMSEQKASTNTIAVNTDNTPYRDAEGEFLFRPAGHGALIENLNERTADVIFVKNIDNVVPSKLRNITTRYKKVIAGCLVATQQRIAEYLRLLDSKKFTPEALKEMLAFVEDVLCTKNKATDGMGDEELAAYLFAKLNRPIRVCGMVRNEGEPGGGPYLAYDEDGGYSPQILEAAQIDENDPDAVALMKSGTHFNPVDLVCYINDYKGRKFNLKDFVDYNTGLISLKSKDGVEIKALELPGLWNGSMSKWNTIFVEVPAETFNPVKTVNDLLRKQHQ